MYNDTHLNVLISYAYMFGQQPLIDFVKEQTSNGTINLMIDSGAFTKFNSKAAMSHINVEDYSKFLKEWRNYAEKYVMLDVIGNRELSVRNYEYMLDCGLSPMFVVTAYDSDFDYIRKAVSNNPDICVSGGATTKNAWMQKRYQDIFSFSGQKAKIHGLAFVTFPLMLQLPLSSVDSSSWKAASLRFGSLQYFKNGLKGLSYKEVLSGKKTLSFEQQKILRNLRVTPQMFCNMEYHRGNYSIEALAGLHANITMQKVCKRKGLDYFMAASNQMDLEKIVYVNDNYNDLDYIKFRKEFLR